MVSSKRRGINKQRSVIFEKDEKKHTLELWVGQQTWVCCHCFERLVEQLRAQKWHLHSKSKEESQQRNEKDWKKTSPQKSTACVLWPNQWWSHWTLPHGRESRWQVCLKGGREVDNDIRNQSRRNYLTVKRKENEEKEKNNEKKMWKKNSPEGANQNDGQPERLSIWG